MVSHSMLCTKIECKIEFSIVELTPEFSSDVGLMLSSCKDCESADIPLSLEQIAQCIQQSEKQCEFCSIDVDNGVVWLQENCPKAHQLLEAFLKKHGHRAYTEVSRAICKARNEYETDSNKNSSLSCRRLRGACDRR